MFRWLPLFPLSSVLFPGASMPLQIFEPRYKEMLRGCLEEDRRFGVVLIREGVEVGGDAVPYSVGAVARISQLGTPSRGVMPLTVVGEQRFRILELDRSKSYLSAQVEILTEDKGEPVEAHVLREADAGAKRFVSTVLASRGAWSSQLRIPDDPLVLSYFIGILATSAPERARQRLLEAASTSERLIAGAAMLEEETERLKNSIMRSGPGLEESLFSSN